MRAIAQGCIRSTKIFIRAGANVNEVDNNENSLLMRASRQGHDQAVGLLIEAGAEIDLKNMINMMINQLRAVPLMPI